MVSEVELVLQYLLVICVFFREMSIQVFAHRKLDYLGFISFCYCLEKISYIFWILMHCHIYGYFFFSSVFLLFLFFFCYAEDSVIPGTTNLYFVSCPFGVLSGFFHHIQFAQLGK